jgi:hypothetical protein
MSLCIARDKPTDESISNRMTTHCIPRPRLGRQLGRLLMAGLLLLVGSISGVTSHAQTLPGVTWTAVSQKPVTGTNPQSIAVGDFNGDGIADIAVGQPGSIGIFIGNGDGTFKPADAGNDGVTISLPLTAPLAIASGAFQSGKPMGIAAVSASYDAVILSNGSGGEMAPAPFTGLTSVTSVATGEFHPGGVADMAVTGLAFGSNPAVGVFLNSGSGTFGAPTLIPEAATPPE